MKPSHVSKTGFSLSTSMNDLHLENACRVARRQLFGSAGTGIGAVALASLLGRDVAATGSPQGMPGLPGLPHHEPKA